MEPIIITDKEKLAGILGWSLSDAGIVSKDVNAMVEALHKKLGEKEWPGEDEYNEQFNDGLADLILARFDAVIVMPDERVVGRIGDTDEQIFDGNDTKVHLDARML